MYTKTRPKRAQLSERKFRKLIQCFGLDLTAHDTSILLGIHRHTANKYYQYFRRLIVQERQEGVLISGEVEVDESYFGPTRIRGKRGRGAGKKTIVFGMFKRNGKGTVYTWIVNNCQIKTIVPIIEQKVTTGSTIYSDDLGTYRFLFLQYDHKLTYHGRSEFADNGNHINGIESFWAYAKHRIRKFKGIRKTLFPIYLQESEWRFNNRGKSLDKELVKLIKKYN